ncbi:D-aminopeptidase [Sphaerisporangium siamense]|uniref:D-aminopeptidase n=1 Tax=Sphaerisporangium siamense TaxID=795645 RepID=A0A7W7GBY4_9ACTN|nr:P1 family peptidase [Sphaerisporangium siamense]MBB4705488.1 D-aminopeptidase [Sphaerisporangium siamense]GII86360.1 D-aminopeptidase [Sphaerisporangium siamense]
MSATAMRARDHGIVIGAGTPGPYNAITDVTGVRVGHTTLIHGDGPRVRGEGPVRTGVTMILPHEGSAFDEPVYAGYHWLNGNGEITGMAYLDEFGLLGSPIGLTNTGSVGVVRDTIVELELSSRDKGPQAWSLPVVGETWDGRLNDIDGQHVKPEHVRAAYAAATGGPVAEGAVGGGTGMICHGFKGGIGTASRVLPEADGGYTVGVLVQANHGMRDRLTVNGVPVGRAMADVPRPMPLAHEGAGSIIGIVATDAPLLPHQCRRLARRAALGVARTGGAGENGSGDGFVCFATHNRDLPSNALDAAPPRTFPVTVLADEYIDPLFWATIEAVEEAIVNVLVAAETMTGADGVTAHGLDARRLAALLA